MLDLKRTYNIIQQYKDNCLLALQIIALIIMIKYDKWVNQALANYGPAAFCSPSSFKIQPIGLIEMVSKKYWGFCESFSLSVLLL